MLTGAYPAFASAEVVVLDKLTYAGDLRNLDPVSGDGRLRFVEGDICDTSLVARLLPGVDLVVHFAAESHVDKSITGSAEFVRANVLGTHSVLQAALDARVDKLVHVSMDEVYGSIAEGSCSEDEPLLPNSPYAAAKASADLLARSFHRTYGLPVCVTRGSNTYGPYQFPEKIIPLFVTNLHSGQQVPLYGDGSTAREVLRTPSSGRCRTRPG